MELISREMAIDHIRVLGGEDRERLIGILNNKDILPTIESRPKGKWTDREGKEIIKSKYCGHCSVCGGWSEYLTDFCGNCGADMRAKEEWNVS